MVRIYCMKNIFSLREKREIKNSLACALSSTAFLAAEETGTYAHVFVRPFSSSLWSSPGSAVSLTLHLFPPVPFHVIYWPSFITLPSPSTLPSMCLQVRKIQPHFFMETQLRLFTAKPQCCPRDINDNPIQSFMFSRNKENCLVCSVFNLICLNYHHSICNQ